MELWTEYEGRTIDGAFRLKKLLLPEGRSAFFSTSNGKGEPTVIRLIASHFDEDEILARWRGVEALGHPNILRLERFGQLVLDDTTVVYAVMEPVDANLAEVVANQRLSVPEARQLAASLASALEILHSNGFVHEHVEPANIYAVGEVVKLRGDCIRETPEGPAGLEARKRDIHNLGVVLLEALIQQQGLHESGLRPALPAPFDRIVPNALNGSWTLSEIEAAVGPVDLSEMPPPASVSPLPAQQAAETAAKPVSAELPTQTGASVAAQLHSIARTLTASTTATFPEVPQSDAQSGSGSLAARAGRVPIEASKGRPQVDPRTLWTAGAIAVLLTIWLAWQFAHATNSGANLHPASSAATTPPVRTAIQPRPAAKIVSRVVTPGATSEQWRVIAFTYNRQDQAQKKVDFISRNHPNLHPEGVHPQRPRSIPRYRRRTHESRHRLRIRS